MQLLYKKIKEAGIKLSLENEVVADIDAIKLQYCVGYSPCLTATRAASGGFWLAFRRRRMTLKEMLRVQGMHDTDPSELLASLSGHAAGHAVGNAMSQNVLQRILARLLPSVGLVSAATLDDGFS